MRHVALQVLGCALALVALVQAAPAAAHQPSDSQLAVRVADGRVTGQWTIALPDLDFAIGLDADGNGEITAGELRVREGDIAAYALARLVVQGDGAACPLQAEGAQQVDTRPDGATTVLRFSAACPVPPQQLQMTYSLFADIDPQHRGLLRLDARGSTRTAIFSPENATQRFDLAAPDAWVQFRNYVVEGVWHIWIGFDHILFLVSLLLPGVLAWQQARWQPVERFRTAFVDVLKIVTAFTVAHSITLSLATLGLVALPSRLVESAIAASVVLAALNNLRPLFQGRRWTVAFVFGLIHGFGFASVLADLGLPQGTLALALVGFNIGVELGQLAIVALFLPLAFALRRTAFYRRVVLIGGSLLIAALAAVWFAERAFDRTILGF